MIGEAAAHSFPSRYSRFVWFRGFRYLRRSASSRGASQLGVLISCTMTTTSYYHDTWGCKAEWERSPQCFPRKLNQLDMPGELYPGLDATTWHGTPGVQSGRGLARPGLPWLFGAHIVAHHDSSPISNQRPAKLRSSGRSPKQIHPSQAPLRWAQLANINMATSPKNGMLGSQNHLHQSKPKP
jgi:hypothetical protein